MPIFRYNETAGNYYAYLIESHGDDANDGLTPETAVETLDRLVEILDTYAGASRRHAVIVKKRIYNEGITYSRNASKPITFEFVGRCEIDGSGASIFRPNILSDIVIYGDFLDYSVEIITSNLVGTAAPRNFFINCSFLNMAGGISRFFISQNVNTYKLINSVVKNSILASGTGGGYRTVQMENCVCIGLYSDNIGILGTPIISKNTIFYNNPSLIYTDRIRDAGNIDYSCVFGNLGVQTQTTLSAAGQNLNGISANPQFTDPTNGQYTVNQSSSCLYRGEGGEHIGIGEGFYLQANILYFQQSAINNFHLTTGRLGFIDPLDNAFIETNPIDIGQIITLESAELAAILPTVTGEFTAGPVHYSHWYPAYSAASTYHKGAGVTDSAILYRSLVDDNLNNTPASSATEWERFTWESGVSYAAGKIVQYTDDKWYKANTATSTSWVAGEWDEVVMTREWNLQVKTGRTYDEAVAADWATIPYNVTPLLDTAGKGNSDDAYNPTTAAVMVFRFIAVRIDAKTIV